MQQAQVLARALFHDDNPDEETLAAATWLYGDLINSFSLAVQKGIVHALGKGK